jgi:glycosyltransferase involved in cell wall biosynthesis
MSDAAAPTDLSVVICTYNGADRLPAVFTALKAQRTPPGVSWDVVVVDNGSTDETQGIVAAAIEEGGLPSLRYVTEADPGLTAARRRGVRETQSPWIAFVDDDNLLEPDWIGAIVEAIARHPEAGGIGGEIQLEWESSPAAYLDQFGFCFAEQKVGPEERRADSLAGAGMVLRREALVSSGWLDAPLLADRTGKSLVSGGDVEIAQRVRAAGYPLWLTPDAVLRHRIPRRRMNRRYLFNINVQLGISSAVVSVLTWPGKWPAWHSMASKERSRWARIAAQGLFWSALKIQHFTQAIAWTCFCIGYSRGVSRCLKLSPIERERLLGAGAARDQLG